MANTLDISDYCKVIDTKGSKTFIFFSAIRTPAKKFSFYKIGLDLTENKNNVIFLNTSTLAWYYDGIPGLGVDITSSAEGLSNIISTLKTTTKVIFIGGSMGAYAAMVFSGLIKNIDNVIVFGPELLLGLEGGYAKNHIKHIDIKRHFDIFELIEKSKAQYSIYIGENASPDVYGVSKLYEKALKNVKIYCFKGLEHDLPKYIVDKYNLSLLLQNDILIENMFIYENLSFIYKYDILSYYYYISSLNHKMTLSDITKFEKMSFNIADTSLNYMVDLIKGRYFLQTSKKQEAIASFKSAVILSNYSPGVFFEYLECIDFKYKIDENLFFNFFNNLDKSVLKFSKYDSALKKLFKIFLKRGNEYEYVIKKISKEFSLNISEENYKQMIGNEVFRASDNMLFLLQGKHSVIELFSGKKKIAEISKRNLFVNLKRRQNYCDKQQIEYKNIIFPDKIFINNEYLNIPIESLYESQYISSRYYRDDINNEYLGSSMKNLKGMFFKTDTHFSLKGNKKAVELILKNAFEEDIFKKYEQHINSFTVEKENFVGDLGRKLIPKVSEKTDFYKAINFRPYDNGIKNGNDGIIVLSENKDALSNKTLLIFGDSFFRSLLPHLNFFYKRIFFCRSRYFHFEIIQNIKPDTIFTGMAERYLSNVSLDEERPDFFTYPYLKNTSINPSKEFSDLFKIFYNNQKR